MATKMKFSYNGKDYCLEYTKDSVKQMEAKGFRVESVLEAPMTMLPELFAGAFKANHEFTGRKIINDIFEAMGNRNELYNTLITMYREQVNALFEEPDEDAGNAIAWEKTV